MAEIILWLADCSGMTSAEDTTIAPPFASEHGQGVVDQRSSATSSEYRLLMSAAVSVSLRKTFWR
jgi:hypothetical protein